MIRPSTIEDSRDAVRALPKILPRGGATKPALSAPIDGAASLDLSALAGVLEYEPGEFTFTALAGTRVVDVQAVLAEHGQYLPFDPPLAERGATLGGTLAAGLSGPGRYRYGGVRDFILGVRYIDGAGNLIRGGGKVVKNAAGFDLPKLMVGSLGAFGLLVEVTFKVFPKPEGQTTVRRRFLGLEAALEAMGHLYTSRLDVDALDLLPDADGASTLWVRLAGLADALSARAERIRSLLGGGEVLENTGDREFWRTSRELAWVPREWVLSKVPLTPSRIKALEAALEGTRAQRRYSAGGNVAWIAWPDSVDALDGTLRALGLSGLVLFGPPGRPLIGVRRGESFAGRVKAALDPTRRFVET